MLNKTKLFLASILALCFTSFGAPVLAAGPDLSTVTAAVDFGTVITAILGVAAALIVVYIAWKGAKMVISAVRGG
ncbi:MAG: phage-related membrane protein [Rhodocyclaceae bacterium]|nr:MAG: phage-related membrane protein [Rhodocyclaceae bacterium]TND01873.1 MAG: phage-related membrane protein [Rhodocyclaceae bacterium]